MVNLTFKSIPDSDINNCCTTIPTIFSMNVSDFKYFHSNSTCSYVIYFLFIIVILKPIGQDLAELLHSIP
jgi:hypothetical protein